MHTLWHLMAAAQLFPPPTSPFRSGPSPTQKSCPSMSSGFLPLQLQWREFVLFYKPLGFQCKISLISLGKDLDFGLSLGAVLIVILVAAYHQTLIHFYLLVDGSIHDKIWRLWNHEKNTQTPEQLPGTSTTHAKKLSICLADTCS